MKTRGRYVGVVCLLLLLVVVNVRAVVSGNDDLKTARLCESAGLTGTAIDFYGRAARWYSPFSSTSSDAIGALVTMADGYRGPGGAKTSLRALYEARSAILASRWIVTPHAEALDGINSRIAMLTTQSATPGAPGSDQAANLALLRKSSAPNPLVALCSTLLFVAWIVATVIGAARIVTPEGRFNGRRGIAWAAASAVLLAGWLLLVSLA